MHYEIKLKEQNL